MTDRVHFLPGLELTTVGTKIYLFFVGVGGGGLVIVSAFVLYLGRKEV